MAETIEYLDEVRNTNSGVVGTCDAIYVIDDIQYIDVRVGDNMYYRMIAANWVVAAKNDE